MSKYSILLILLTLFAPLANSEDYVLIGNDVIGKTLDLRGDTGFNGRDGSDGYIVNCESGVLLNGNHGEDGEDGERGEKGDDLYIYIDDLSLLKQLRVNQLGGRGGLPGKGGKGSEGCHGGYRGENGQDGDLGLDGVSGKTYILEESFQLPQVKQAQLTTLGELVHNPVVLGRHIWKPISGLKKLLKENSLVREHYYEYEQTKYYQIDLQWNAQEPLRDYFNTKIAFSINKGYFQLTSYQGALLDYKVINHDNGHTIVVDKVIQSYQIQNLKLKKLRGEGEDLLLEIKEKYRSFAEIENRFVISFTKLDKFNNIETNFGFYEVPNNLVSSKNNSYFLKIGKMRIPNQYKQKGTKLKIQVTIYRKVRGQTRAQGLTGIFKI